MTTSSSCRPSVPVLRDELLEASADPRSARPVGHAAPQAARATRAIFARRSTAVTRMSEVLNAKISVRRMTRAARTRTRDERACADPSIRWCRRARRASAPRARGRVGRGVRNSPSVASACRKLRRRSTLPRPRVGTSRRLRRAASRARGAPQRLHRGELARESCSKGLRRSDGLGAVARRRRPRAARARGYSSRTRAPSHRHGVAADARADSFGGGAGASGGGGPPQCSSKSRSKPARPRAAS